jgi:hypothetical protein
MNAPGVLQAPWWRRIVRYGRWLVGAHRFDPDSIFARNGEDRWTTPRRYEEQDLRVVCWQERRRWS